MRFWIFLLMAALALAKKTTPRPTTRRKTKEPTPLAPTVAPVLAAPTTNPTSFPSTARPAFHYTAAQYYYYSDLYYERAKFIYDNFPHVGPSFSAAQIDQVKGRFYKLKAKLAAAAEEE